MKEYVSRILLGVFILSIGVIALLSNFGVIDYSLGELIRNFWPLLIVYWGLQLLAKPGNIVQRIIGLLVAFIGVVLIANRIEYEPLMFDLSTLWQLLLPMIFILAGVSLLTGKRALGKSHYAVLSGLERKRDQWMLSSENYTALLGGVELDMRRAEIPKGETHIHLTALFGGIEVKVPQDLTIICEGKAAFGGIEQLGDESAGIFTSKKVTTHRPNLPESHPNFGKTLHLYSSATFGGIEIDFS